jgi:hypothetical protein
MDIFRENMARDREDVEQLSNEEREDDDLFTLDEGQF